MVAALFDTNILIDYLNAIPEARRELDRYTSRAVSVVTWMEILAGAPPELEAATRAFLDGFEVVDIDRRIADGAVRLRRAHRMELPDAIVWASAQAHGRILVSRNTKDFPPDDPGVRVPYRL